MKVVRLIPSSLGHAALGILIVGGTYFHIAWETFFPLTGLYGRSSTVGILTSAGCLLLVALWCVAKDKRDAETVT